MNIQLHRTGTHKQPYTKKQAQQTITHEHTQAYMQTHNKRTNA